MKPQKGILFDSTQCVGCGECYFACKKANNLPETNKDPLKDRLSASTYNVVEQYGETYTRKFCMHCAEPTCASVCPVGAITKSAEGPVVYDETKCIGCRYCMQACPHSIPRYEWSSLNPRVRKCTMCHSRVEAGKDTACAEACPAGATKFGNLQELITEAKQRLVDSPDTYYPHVYGLQEAGGSNVLVLASMPFDKLGYVTKLPNDALPKYTMRALEKIPTVVSAGTVFLGGMYWLTKRRNEIAKEKQNGHERKDK
ncbi:MAG: 4Fe-4S dicluster domain-containing protein [Ignavibacteriales bacterium]|nr:4Fe-4S dicluster domain-containing protein [Ignavibacteriales bacterium]